MVTICDDPADNEVLVLRPVRQGYDSRIPKDSRLRFCRVLRYVRDVLDDVWQSDVLGILIRSDRTAGKDFEVRIQNGRQEP